MKYLSGFLKFWKKIFGFLKGPKVKHNAKATLPERTVTSRTELSDTANQSSGSEETCNMQSSKSPVHLPSRTFRFFDLRRDQMNPTMLQYFEWYLPDDGLLWRKAQADAEHLSHLGVTMLWLPPAYKGSCRSDVGYGVYDRYDLGEFDQKGTIRTKYGTRAEYLSCCAALQHEGIDVLADIVMNHMLAADESEEAEVVQVDPQNRLHDISGVQTIRAWTRFTFPGRKGKYSSFTWSKDDFTGIDYDASSNRNGIFRMKDKQWNTDVDTENGNFDYLMGADLDFNNPEVQTEMIHWGKWYYDTVHMDGFRLDALKHISWSYVTRWLQEMRAYAGKDLYAVGEMWCPELQKILSYADHTNHCMHLFDAPLHYKFMSAGQMWDRFPMRYLFRDTLVERLPDEAVTCVDNHDTEPGQALSSYVEDWFKPLAYAMILLRKDGTPCVFYGDLYGVPDHRIRPVSELPALMRIRKDYAYGEQKDYLDDDHLIGWTRSGDNLHKDSGIAVVLTNGADGRKRMYIGRKFSGMEFLDALGKRHDRILIDTDGCGDFPVSGGSVSVWVTERAYEKIQVRGIL